LSTQKGSDLMLSNYKVQRELGADLALLNPQQLESRFPWLNVNDIHSGELGITGEGWFDPYGLMMGFRNKSKSLGATFIHDEVVGLKMGDTITVQLQKNGTISCKHLVNAAGPRAATIYAMTGESINEFPVRPKKRCVFVFQCRDHNIGHCPLVIDPNGVYFRPEGANFICGVSPPPEEDGDAPFDDFDVDNSLFERMIWPTLAHRVPQFEAIKVVSAWAGHYDFNTFDQNAIIGRHPKYRNFYFANGFSGHGLQQSPAAGRAISELILDNGYQTIDLTRFAFERIERNEKVIESEIV